jgi:hypothetical protein
MVYFALVGGLVPQIKLPNSAEPVNAVEVEVEESTERWTDVKLKDGSTLRIKPVLLKAFRAENVFDQDGNPVYQVKVNQVMSVSAPDHLKKDGTPKDVH